MPKMLVPAGLVLIAVGLVWLVGERAGPGRLPGDFGFERKNFRLNLRLARGLIVSAILTLLLWFFGR